MEHALETFISKMTLAELSAKTGKSIAAIAEFAVNGKSHTKTTEIATQATESKPKTKTKTKKAKAKNDAVNVRSAEGREAYRKAVYTAIAKHGDTIGAEELRPIVGGEATQLRAALKALVADKLLVRMGKARATTYGVKGTKSKTTKTKTTKGKAKSKKKAPPRVAKTKAKEAAGETLDVRILKYLRKRNAISTTEEMAEALEVAKATVTKAIKGMEIDGTIEPKDRPKDGESGFVITEKGKKAY